MENKKKTFEHQISALRNEIVKEIIALLEEYSLTKVEFDADEIEAPYVLWYIDGDGWYDCRITAISISNGNIYLDILEEENGYEDTIDSNDYYIATTNLDWLNEIIKTIIDVLTTEEEEDE